MKTYAIAAIPGDGIGTEVVAAGVEVLHVLAQRDAKCKHGCAIQRILSRYASNSVGAEKLFTQSFSFCYCFRMFTVTVTCGEFSKRT